jgi:hypothetical protein
MVFRETLLVTVKLHSVLLGVIMIIKAVNVDEGI